MWWTGQNMDKPIVAKNGSAWAFLVWSDFENGIHIQRIFFWDKFKHETGIFELKGGNTVHRNKLKDKMKKLANDKRFREKYLCEIKFPVQQNY